MVSLYHEVVTFYLVKVTGYPELVSAYFYTVSLYRVAGTLYRVVVTHSPIKVSAYRLTVTLEHSLCRSDEIIHYPNVI